MASIRDISTIGQHERSTEGQHKSAALTRLLLGHAAPAVLSVAATHDLVLVGSTLILARAAGVLTLVVGHAL